ncbi:hypothetical protein RJ55_04381 [Drechmeria coniospora]|nr:hypothetical protein RJ55_04381 [Drechmeria coniospora]
MQAIARRLAPPRLAQVPRNTSTSIDTELRFAHQAVLWRPFGPPFFRRGHRPSRRYVDGAPNLTPTLGGTPIHCTFDPDARLASSRRAGGCEMELPGPRPREEGSYSPAHVASQPGNDTVADARPSPVPPRYRADGRFVRLSKYASVELERRASVEQKGRRRES